MRRAGKRPRVRTLGKPILWVDEWIHCGARRWTAGGGDSGDGSAALLAAKCYGGICQAARLGGDVRQPFSGEAISTSGIRLLVSTKASRGLPGGRPVEDE